MKFALGIGAFFLFGGISMVVMCGGPVWFILCDLLLAYIPMAYLGGNLADRKDPPAEDRGREVRLSRTPLPPNRACGFPAHGSPVNGCPMIGVERNGCGRLADFETPDP